MNNIYKSSDQKAITAVVNALKEGNIAIIPTDTVYGVAAIPDKPEAVEKIYRAKARDGRKPIAFLASDIEMVEAIADMSAAAKHLAQKYWPGALTLVLQTNDNSYEGFRIPNHEFTRKVIRECGGLLRVTSANLSGEPDACSLDAAVNYIGKYVDVSIDDGESPGGIPSTVVKDTPEGLTILRQGECKIENK